MSISYRGCDNMNTKNENMIFTDVGDSNSAILGTLEGPCADFIDPTRNDRHYSESLWEKTFSDPIFNELIENGGIPGELDHPPEREEIDSSRIAILMREKPVKKDGKYWAKFSILNTPLGKIAYTLAKAGFNLGVSSRGTGDLYDNADGSQEVDEDTYDFKCFDLVLLPAVKDARLKLVSESLQKKFDYKKALVESLNSASDEDRKLMKETLDNLNIDIENNSSYQQNAVNDISEESDNIAVDNNEAMVEELQETLKKVKQLEDTVIELQEKLSVSYTKEAKSEAQITKYKKAILKLSENANKVTALTTMNEKLQHELNVKGEQLDNTVLKLQEAQETSKKQTIAVKKLTETLSESKQDVSIYESEKQSLLEEFQNKERSLNEQLESMKKDAEINKLQYSQKLSKANKLVEKYKSIAEKAVSRYIKSRAVQIGVDEIEIRNRLAESYTFDDIDNVCEQVQKYNLSMSKLPFNTRINENMRMKISSHETEQLHSPKCSEDDIDNDLLSLAGLN